MTFKITLAFLLITILSIGQEKDSTHLKEIEFAEMLVYSFSSEIFKKQDYNIDVDKTYKLPWSEAFYSTEEINQALDTVIKNATFKIEENSFSYHLKFNSYFPELITDTSIDFFKLAIKSSEIYNKTTRLSIQHRGSSGFGFHFAAGFKNENSYSHQWKTLNTTFNIKTAIETEEYEGSVQFEGSFVNGYDYQVITTSDIGKQMKIGNHKFTVVDIINNSVILDFNTNIDHLDFKFVNLNKSGHRLISKDGMFVSQSIFKDVYQFFKQKPNTSFEDYKSEFHLRYVELIENAKNKEETDKNIFGKKYKAISTSGKLINGYLYLPKYISRTFEIVYDKNKEEHVPKPSINLSSESHIGLTFEDEEEHAVLIGENIELFDENLNLVDTIKTGTFITTLGKTSIFYNQKKSDESCDGYRYVKISYNGKEYIVAGKNVFKLIKYDTQPDPSITSIEFYGSSPSNDYLQILLPGEDFDFCEHLIYKPVILYDVKTEKFSFIEVIKEGDIYEDMSDSLKTANFFQSNTDLKHIQTAENGMVLSFKNNTANFKVLIAKKKNNFTATYIE